jgi:hypothetical protein
MAVDSRRRSAKALSGRHIGTRCLRRLRTPLEIRPRSGQDFQQNAAAEMADAAHKTPSTTRSEPRKALAASSLRF